MQSPNLKTISNLLFAVAFICAAMMLTNRVYGYRSLFQLIFLVSGALALIISLISSRLDAYREDFNVIFWIGNVIVFIGLVLRNYSAWWIYVFIGGMAITALSYFIDPFSRKKNEQDDDLLDR